MAFSTQLAVSDGSLVLLNLSIEYFDRDEITVYFDNVQDALPWAWVGVTDTQISFSPAVPIGVEVLVKRTTPLADPLHEFDGGAQFTNKSLDENFLQILRLMQEVAEGGGLQEVFTNLNLHGNKVTNLGDGTAPGDAVNFGQFSVHDATILGYRDAAAASASAASGSQTAAAASESAALASENTASTQAGIATTKAGEASASAGVATTKAGEALASATSASDSAATATTKAGEASASAIAAAADAVDAETAADVAMAAANYVGAWAGLTGALSPKASTTHNGSAWLLEYAVADVTLEVPGVSAAWTVLPGADAAALVAAHEAASGVHIIAGVTGLQAALDAKQATLVSGTNIKTVRGASILGSGDLTRFDLGHLKPIVTAISRAADVGDLVAVTVAGTTQTLPPTPSDGDVVGFIVYNFVDTIVGRNSSLIEGLAEDMTLDAAYRRYYFMYFAADTTWRLIHV